MFKTIKLKSVLVALFLIITSILCSVGIVAVVESKAIPKPKYVIVIDAGHGGRGSDNRNAEILPGKPERKPCRAFRNVLNNLLEIRSRESAGRGTLIDDKYSIYSCDDKESAHYEILDIKRNYQGKTDNTIYGTNEKPNALYYMKIYENRNPI